MLFKVQDEVRQLRVGLVLFKICHPCSSSRTYCYDTVARSISYCILCEADEAVANVSRNVTMQFQLIEVISREEVCNGRGVHA